MRRLKVNKLQVRKVDFWDQSAERGMSVSRKTGTIPVDGVERIRK